MAKPAQLTVRNLRLSFSPANGGKPLEVLSGISFDVSPGSLVSIIGPSGSGKTTLLRAIDGLLTCDEGEVLIDGLRVSNPADFFAVVFQDARLLPWRTILRNVELSIEFRTHRRINSAQREAARSYLDAVGLLPFADYYPSQVSGGMQQRAGVARALAREPRVLLLDEPFGALDAQTRIVMQDFFLSLQKRFGFTALMVTHDIDEAINMSAKCVVLSKRPATVRSVVEFDLPPWEAGADHRAHPSVPKYHTQIWEMLRDDAFRAAEA
jgi:NitT/TauT family transport system ATP-binding protein